MNPQAKHLYKPTNLTSAKLDAKDTSQHCIKTMRKMEVARESKIYSLNLRK